MSTHSSDSFLAGIGNLIADNFILFLAICGVAFAGWSQYSVHRENVEKARADAPVLTAPQNLVEVPALSECVTKSARGAPAFAELGTLSTVLAGRAEAKFYEGGIIGRKPHWETTATFEGWGTGVPNAPSFSVPVPYMRGDGALYHGYQLDISSKGAVVLVPSQAARKASDFDLICYGLSDVVKVVLDKARWIAPAKSLPTIPQG